MKQPRIGLAGGICAGKSTTAHTYKQFHAPGTQILSFAAPVKEIAHDLFDASTKDRDLLQRIGTSMREIDKDVWAKFLIRSIDDSAEAVIVDDVRYPNEVETLKRNGFTIVWLEIGQEERLRRIKKLYGPAAQAHERGLEHESENHAALRPLVDRVVDTTYMSSTLIAASLATTSLQMGASGSSSVLASSSS